MLKDMGEKIGAADRSAIESAMEGVKKAIEGTDAAAIEKALEQLTAAQHKAAEAMYKQQAPGGGPSSGPGGGEASAPSGPDAKSDVIDAEVVDEGKQ
jgi:molecular chaperone DnaK